jgi:hypothetical protein
MQCFWILGPLALIACSTSSPGAPTTNVDASGGGSGSSSGNGGGSSSGSGTGPDAAASGGDDSGGGEGAAPVADAGPGGSDGSTDAPSSGASGDAGPCPGLFCEDFEQGQGQLDTTTWNLQMGGGGMGMVEQQIVGHGKYAFQVHGTGAGGGFATILLKNPPAALKAGPVFGRLYLYATANYGAHIQLGVAGTNPVNPMAVPTITPNINFNYMEFAEFSNSWQVGFDLFTPAPNVAKGFVEEASYPPARDPYPTMKWNCIEWEFGDNPEMMLLWVDGKQIDQFDLQHISFSSTMRTPGSVLNGLNSGIVGGYTVFGFGFHSYGTSAVVDRYYDDIVLDTKRVNCLP